MRRTIGGKEGRIRGVALGILLTQIFSGGCIFFYPPPPPVHFVPETREDGCMIDVVSMSRGRLDRNQNGHAVLHIRPGITTVHFRVSGADCESEFFVELSAVTGLLGGFAGIEGATKLCGAIWWPTLQEVYRTAPDLRYYDLSISGRPASLNAFLVGVYDYKAPTSGIDHVRKVPPDTVAKIEGAAWLMSCRGKAGASLILDVWDRTIGREFDIRAPQGTRIRIRQEAGVRTFEFREDGRRSVVLEPGAADFSWFRSNEGDAEVEVSLDVSGESEGPTWLVFSSTRDR